MALRWGPMRAASIVVMVSAASALACSSTSSASSGGLAPDAGSGDAATADPCAPDRLDGTFQIKGTLNGTETICGLSLGSFDGATLTIADATTSNATVTVTNSGKGHIDVDACKATVSRCTVTASCSGSTDKQATVGLNVTVSSSTVSGSSSLGFNGCQAPGLSFTGTR